MDLTAQLHLIDLLLVNAELYLGLRGLIMKSPCHWLLVFFLPTLMLTTPTQCCAHGGIPGVIDLVPPQTESSEDFWLIDTLGLFRGQANSLMTSPIDQRSWSWLCDDAVDPMLGVDALLVIDSDTLVALALSGIYRSTDFGCTFTRLDSPINQHTIGGISAHHSQANEIVVFTNSIGSDNRVWWSGDKGETWTPSDLLVSGGIFGLWRDPNQPDDIWVNHAEGLSVSHDGGRRFTTLDAVNYSGASPYEVRLLSGGYIDDRLVLWASLDHYPTSSLLISEDSGQNWKEIHNLNDAYDELALTEDALWVSTIFSGLFVYPLTELENSGHDTAWSGTWQNYPEHRVSCLTPDPLEPKALWACGHSGMGWLVGRSEDLGQTWSIAMERYQEASEGVWACPADSVSLNACSTRCLDDDCDPSQNQIMTEVEDLDLGTVVNTDQFESNETLTDDLMDQDENLKTKTNSGCQTRSSLPTPLTLLLLLLSQIYMKPKSLKSM